MQLRSVNTDHPLAQLRKESWLRSAKFHPTSSEQIIKRLGSEWQRLLVISAMKVLEIANTPPDWLKMGAVMKKHSQLLDVQVPAHRPDLVVEAEVTEAAATKRLSSS